MILLNGGLQMTGVGYALQTSSSGNSAVTESYGPTSTSMSLGTGTAANQADRGYPASAVTLTNSSITYILSALPNGQAMARARWFHLKVTSALSSGGTLSVAPSATHGWAGVMADGLLPGSICEITWPDTDGFPVTAGSADQVTFTATGTVTFDLVILGCSA